MNPSAYQLGKDIPLPNCLFIIVRTAFAKDSLDTKKLQANLKFQNTSLYELSHLFSHYSLEEMTGQCVHNPHAELSAGMNSIILSVSSKKQKPSVEYE